MTTLKLDNNTTPLNLIAGQYDIYIIGGRDVEMSSSFKIKVINALTAILRRII